MRLSIAPWIAAMLLAVPSAASSQVVESIAVRPGAGLQKDQVVAARVFKPEGAEPQRYDDINDNTQMTQGKAAGIGFVVGALIGGIYAGAKCSSNDCMSVAPVVLFAVGGGVLGAIVGLLLGPSPRS